jgi:hypothetical protein
MIVFQSDLFRIDLSKYNVSLKEKSSLFSDNIYQSYSLPFVVPEASEIIKKLGLPTLNNIINLKTSISGRLLFFDKFYSCKFYIQSYKSDNLNCKFTFGDNKPDGFDAELKNLGWENISNINFNDHAVSLISKSWPETSHQFPLIHDAKIQEEDNYEKFLGFINNYDQLSGSFLSNQFLNEVDDDGDTVSVLYNRNVMMPCVYLAEILQKGYKLAGKEVLGEFINHETIKKIIYKPDTFLEKFYDTQFETFIFSNPESVNPEGGTDNYYLTTFDPQEVGSYELYLKFNLPRSIASSFDLKVTVDDVLFKEYSSSLSRVILNEKLKINIEGITSTTKVKVELFIPFTTINIEDYNTIQFSFAEGDLNLFPRLYNLGEFMPDMKFGEFVNFIKNWFNLDIKTFDNYVIIDFLENNITRRRKRDHEHLKVNDAEFSTNENKVYKLQYDNDQKVIVNKQGQIYNEIDIDVNKIVEIKVEASALVSEFKRRILTAVASENESKFDFMYYDGLTANRVPSSAALSTQNVYDLFWKKWLRTRINSKTVKESFRCSAFETFDKDEILKKYNEFIFPKEINIKYLNSETVEVSIEGETL